MSIIGILVGRERTFTDALVERINSGGDAQAEYITVGGVRMAEDPGYRVVLDRISHAAPFYQSYLKNAALMGAHVVNDPFWQLAEDKFLDVGLARANGLVVPRTVLLPNRELEAGLGAKDLTNLAQPLDWEAAMAWVGFPMIMRPHWGAGSRKAFLLHSPEELQARWQRSGTGQYILQEWLTGATYVHCLVIGNEALAIIRPLRQAPNEAAERGDTTQLEAQVRSAALAVSRILGYQMNAVELAVRGDELMVTDWLNHCPPVDPNGLTAAELEWAVARAAELLLHLANTPKGPIYRWDPLLGGEG